MKDDRIIFHVIKKKKKKTPREMVVVAQVGFYDGQKRKESS